MKSHAMNIDKLNLIPLSLASLTILIGTILVSSIVSADDSVVDEINITVPVSCTMTGTGMDSHNAEIQNGIYEDNIGTTTLHAFCNDNEGFAIYAAGYTGNEIGGENSNKLVGTNASNNATIVSGIATTAGSPDISNWAMKLAISQDSGDTTGTNAFTIDSAPNVDLPSEAEQSATPVPFSEYHVVPNEYVKVAHKNSMTDMTESTGGVKLTTTYAAYISKTQAADTYSGQVIYTLVHPSDAEAPLSPQQATAGCINYFANASTAVGTMGCQSATDGSTITLLASNFSRTGYGFAGWSDKYDYTTNSSAKFYGPQEDITVPEGTTANGLALYAVWIKSEGSIQDTDKVASLCGTNGTGGTLTTAPTDGTANLTSVSALTDQRDNQTYAIAKLADGNCWMIENLRLEAENTRTPEKQALAQGYGTSTTYGNFGGLADAENSGFSSTYTANSLYYSGTQEGTASIDIGTSNYPGYRMPRYNNLNTSTRASNPTSNTFPNKNTTGGMYSYGNYYTWHAAIADLTYNGTNNQSTTGTSLCPAGWHLPKGGNKSNEANNELWSLVVDGINDGTKPANYGSSTTPNYTGTPEGSDASNKLRAYPNNFLYSGNFGTSSASNRGRYGYYWSSTAFDSNTSYCLYLGSSLVRPGTHGFSKYYGYSIRCTVGS